MTTFTTRLQSTCALTGDWEMALVDITFPRTWYTLDQVEDLRLRAGGWFAITCKGVGSVRNYFYERCVPAGYYDTVADVVKVINDICARLPTTAVVMNALKENAVAVDSRQDEKTNVIPHYFPKLRYVPSSKKCVIEIMKNQTIQFSPTLATILGLSSRQNPTKMRDADCVLKSDLVADINRGINSLYVYCDLLECVPVGDTKAPLLRTVDASGANGEIIHKTFEQLRYIPLQKKNFDCIEILIRDDLGQPVPFESGKLVVTLHLREAKSKYYH